MDPPIRSLPPLKSLLAFEAVVRLGSVTAAARELGSTQPAVSQQVRVLETTMGQSLFSREGRRLSPNTAGRTLFEPVSQALWDMADATNRLRDAGAATRVAIGTNFGFAHLWLLPRFAELQAEFPECEIFLATTDRDSGPELAECEITVRFDLLSALPKSARRLFVEQAFPVCSPAFAQRNPGIREAAAEELLRYPLLHLDENDPRWLDWRGWLRRQRVLTPPRRPALLYQNYPLLLNAAVAGEGLALGWTGLVDEFIDSGALIALDQTVRRKDHGYLITTARGVSPTVRAVADWIADQATGTST